MNSVLRVLVEGSRRYIIISCPMVLPLPNLLKKIRTGPAVLNPSERGAGTDAGTPALGSAKLTKSLFLFFF